MGRINKSAWCIASVQLLGATRGRKGASLLRRRRNARRRITGAQGVYSVSPAQTRLSRLIVDGQDPRLGLRSARGQRQHVAHPIQRILVKTGIRAALVRVLLSAETRGRVIGTNALAVLAATTAAVASGSK
jgi:hypothetical protein